MNMNQNFYRFIILLSIIVTGIIGLNAQNAESNEKIENDAETKRLDLIIQHYVEERGFSGSIIIEKSGRTVLSKGYGMAHRGKKIPFKPETAFSIGTLSQHFLATSFVILQEAGKIDLHAPITNFLDKVPKEKQKITVHHLLTHTSGLPDFYVNRSDHFKIGREEAIHNILKQDLKNRPGGRFYISNSGYNLLAAIFEKITNKSYLTFLKEDIFDRYGLDKTGFHGDHIWPEQNIAKGYGFNEKGSNIPSEWPKPSWMIMGTSEIVSNAPDILAWWKMLLTGQVVSESSLALMMQKHSVDKTKRFIEYGYGIKKKNFEEKPVYYYNGGGEYGQICSMRYYPEDDMHIVLLSNSYVNINPLASVLISQVEKAMLHPEVYTKPNW